MKKRFFTFLSIILLLTSITVFAKDEWSYSGTVYCNNEAYTEMRLGVSDGIMPGTFDVYKVNWNDIDHYVITPENTKDLAFFSGAPNHYSPKNVYVSQQVGEDIFDDFAAGKFSSYALFKNNSENYNGPIDNNIITTLDNSTETEEMSVSGLLNYQEYQVAGLDETGTLFHIHGAIYKRANQFYYVNYDVLDNSYFDSDGNFSYRKGTVNAVVVPDDLAREIGLYIAMISYKATDYNETYDMYHTANEHVGSMVLFVISTAILGYILPLVPFILSLVFARSKKALYPKRWYLVTLCSAVWMIVATCLVVIILLN